MAHYLQLAADGVFAAWTLSTFMAHVLPKGWKAQLFFARCGTFLFKLATELPPPEKPS